MAVDQAGRHQPPAAIDGLGPRRSGRRQAGERARIGDAAVADQQRPVLDEAEAARGIGQGRQAGAAIEDRLGHGASHPIGFGGPRGRRGGLEPRATCIYKLRSRQRPLRSAPCTRSISTCCSRPRVGAGTSRSRWRGAAFRPWCRDGRRGRPPTASACRGCPTSTPTPSSAAWRASPRRAGRGRTASGPGATSCTASPSP